MAAISYRSTMRLSGQCRLSISFRDGWPRSLRKVVLGFAGLDSLPYLQAMDGNVFIDVEAESYNASTNLEHGDFEHALEARGASDDHGFFAFP